MTALDWWDKPRRISVVVDNPSWILPYAETLLDQIRDLGDDANFCNSYDSLAPGDVAFFLGCIRIAGADVLQRHRRNLVVHESDLPAGRGFAPLVWQILEGRNEITVCLIEAEAGEADSGPIIYRDRIVFEGHELHDEIRHAQGQMTVALCRRFLEAPEPPEGVEQTGRVSHYKRRRPADGKLDPDQPLRAQFDLLRTCDSARYPAHFDLAGHRYKLTVEKISRDESK